MHRLTIRVDFADGSALGPGKARLLELVAETGSIRKAAARMKMSYRRAWLLLQALAEMFGEPLVDTVTGGKQGGGARLTPKGARVAGTYRRLEAAAERAGEGDLMALSRLLARRCALPPDAALRQDGRGNGRKAGKKCRKKPA